MDELDLLKKLERAKAPSDFEEKVLAQLYQRKKRNLSLKYLRFSLAGAFSAALIIFVVLNVFIFHKKSPVQISEFGIGISPAFQVEEKSAKETIPVIETVDYKQEIRTLSPEPRTIYILEQVADGSQARIRY